MPIEPQQVILQYAVEWFTACKAMTTSTAICVMQLRWQHPMPGIFKLKLTLMGVESLSLEELLETVLVFGLKASL